MENLDQIMQESEAGNTAQHRRDLEAYQNWRKKDRCVHFIILSNMQNDLLCEFEQYTTTNEMWQALASEYGVVSSTKLRELNMKFNTYKKKTHHSMKQHLRTMSTMIRELRAIGINLTNEQLV